MRSGIAIVGLSCRYPDAASPGELWENVLAQRRAFRRFPDERLRLADYHSDDRSRPDKTYSREASVIEDYEFDRVKFRVAGSTYRSADLVHWLALDVSSQALQDAGFPDGEGLPRESTGVLLGNTLTGEFSRANLMRLRWPYVRRVTAAALTEEGWDSERRGRFLGRLEQVYKAPYPGITEESLAGGLSNTIAGRICNHFDLQGGGYTVDGACSSSLLAVANACNALQGGDLDVALAGGVDLSLDPFEIIGFAKTGALAEGDMRVYDAQSTGFIPGEGCGFVALMRHEDALEQGRRIYAVIRGWGISSDGSGGITRPEVEGQKLALKRAYRRADFGIEDISYFEGHGTGTSVGDSAELQALTGMRREGPSAPPAVLGSIKANIGHTKAAAGVAGVIKAALAVKRQILPPHTGFRRPHPELTDAEPTIRLLRKGEIWPQHRPLRAAVSAMGFGGINTHIVLEGAGEERRPSLSLRERCLLQSSQDVEIFFLAGRDRDSLMEHLRKLLAYAHRISRAQLTDLAAQLSTTGLHGKIRAAVVASTPSELADRLAVVLSWLEQGVGSRLDVGQGAFLGGGRRARLGFLFSGQGSPANLGGGALRRRFETVERLYRASKGPRTGDGVATEVAQPAIVTASIAALGVLEELGLSAQVAVGHSLGELTALHWSGALDRDSVLRVAAVRGQAMAGLESPTGSMLNISASDDEVEGILSESSVVIAGLNSPADTVVSGSEEEIAEIDKRARARGFQTTRLRVSHAFHSPLVRDAAPGLRKALQAVEIGPVSRNVISTVTGAALEPDVAIEDLLVRQLTSPVRFREAVLKASRDLDLWIEVGPGQILSGLVSRTVDVPAISVDAGGESLKELMHAIGASFALGLPIQAESLFTGRLVRPFDLDYQPRFLASPCEAAPALDEIEDPDQANAGEETSVADSAALEETNPLELVRKLVAERAELPLSVVKDESRLLDDLHLNSISVGELVATAARRLGLSPPTAPTEYANATVKQLAGALEEMSEREGPGSLDESWRIEGVDGWVRPFQVVLAESPLPVKDASEDRPSGRWQVFAPKGNPVADGLGEGGRALPGNGVALCLPAAPGQEELPLFVEAARAACQDGNSRLLVVQHGEGAGGWARTFFLENPEITTVVLDIPPDHPGTLEWIAAEVSGADGYVEARYDRDGIRRESFLRLSELPEKKRRECDLSSRDVVLISGGGKGIAAECALSLAQTFEVRLVLLGRSSPSDDPELTANLERMKEAGLSVTYKQADVTDADAVREAVSAARRDLGEVTAIIHGAGLNKPRLLKDLKVRDLERTLAPKLQGLENLLASIDPRHLRYLMTFGSIIARTGMRGEADYALANEWMRLRTDRFQEENPHCRCLTLEWSVWSGVGMGERLGRIDSLLRQGVTPIPPEEGIRHLERLWSAPATGSSVIVTGRYWDTPTLKVERHSLPLLRFLEEPKVYVPGVELVSDTVLSAETDPYLKEHVFRGERLFPAVLGLEAMAQAATAVTGLEACPSFEDVRFHRPVVVARKSKMRIRVAALVRGPGRVELSLRSESTDFKVDHFQATCVFLDRTLPEGGPSIDLNRNGRGPLPLNPREDLYEGILFHQGRFRRLKHYWSLMATQCMAEIVPDGSRNWFGRYLPQGLLLGDPGTRDAAIHAIQACIPHATILPLAVERIECRSLPFDEPSFLAAKERFREGDTLVYDLEVLSPDGRVKERWVGLRLRIVDQAAAPPSWAVPLLGTYSERRLGELIPDSVVRIALERSEDSGRSARAVASITNGSRLFRRPDGKPEVHGEKEISVAHTDGLVMAVSGKNALGCDLEPVVERSSELWSDLLGAERFQLTRVVAQEIDEDADTSATRVWAACECLKKAGALLNAPLSLQSTTEDGWVLLTSGSHRIGTFVANVQGVKGPLALAVSVEREIDKAGTEPLVSVGS